MTLPTDATATGQDIAGGASSRVGTRAPHAVALAAGGLLFLVLATANGGGYRYGVSDQAFWIPAAVRALQPASFPRDAGLIDAAVNGTGRLFDGFAGALRFAQTGRVRSYAFLTLGGAVVLLGFLLWP